MSSQFPTPGGDGPVAPPVPAVPTDPPPGSPSPRFRWGTNLVLFVATAASVWLMGWLQATGEKLHGAAAQVQAAAFAVPVMAILLAHEFGHYFAARLHRVPTSLPYFIPFPIPGLSLFGTLGAVILMPGRIRSSRALLDIGAAGPLSGMAVAVPAMLVGLSKSKVIEKSTTDFIQEGQSLLYMALKWLSVGPLGPNQDVSIHPTAFAAWFGFFLTFLNLVPFAQLDGGHVAYALFGRLHHTIARWILYLPAVMVLVNLWLHGLPVITEALRPGHDPVRWTRMISALSPWVMAWILLLVVKSISGLEHPPVDDEKLGLGRRIVAWATLALFVLLFMPAPLVAY
ncbi:MAG: site-2 protease family protein [Polyangiaceae bacterium]|nr:site-2 protease family protein [Polyangiaceae bacterium]